MLKKNSTTPPLYWILPKSTNLQILTIATTNWPNLYIPTYSITNSKVNSTLTITIQQIIQ